METIKKTIHRDKVVVEEVGYSKYGVYQASLKQKVTTTSVYPVKRISNSLQDNVFSLEDFGGEASEEYTSTSNRAAFVPIPEGTTLEKAKEAFGKHPNACIYRILSYQPILTAEQAAAISSPKYDLTLEQVAEGQVCRYPKGHENEGEIIVDSHGRHFFRATFFSKTSKEDLDYRTKQLIDGVENYTTEAIQSELEGSPVVNHQADIVGQDL